MRARPYIKLAYTPTQWILQHEILGALQQSCTSQHIQDHVNISEYISRNDAGTTPTGRAQTKGQSYQDLARSEGKIYITFTFGEPLHKEHHLDDGLSLWS